MRSPNPNTVIRILIIEDNAQCAEELQRAFKLRERGLTFDVSVAASASKAAPFIEVDETDVYVVDLELPEFEAAPNEMVGEALVKKIIQNTNGGVIIHTGMLRTDREDFLWGGVDDYIVKGDSISNVVARAFAVWRRVKEARNPTKAGRKDGRWFRLGKWKFEGNRNLVSDEGESIRLSPTELAFVRYLCTVDAEIDRREFNVAVLGRPAYEENKRIDNLVYRLREKLGDSFQLVSRHNGGTYKLINFEELPRK